MLVELYIFVILNNQSTCFFSRFKGLGCVFSSRSWHYLVERIHHLHHLRFSFGSGDWRQASDTWKRLGFHCSNGLKKRFDMSFQNKIPTPPRIIWPYCVPSSIFFLFRKLLSFSKILMAAGFLFRSAWIPWWYSTRRTYPHTWPLSHVLSPQHPSKTYSCSWRIQGRCVWVMSQKCCVIRVLCLREFHGLSVRIRTE